MFIKELILGAVDILTHKDSFKDNLKKKSTAASVPAAVASAALPGLAGFEDGSLEAGLTQLALGVIAIVLFFYRKHVK